MKLKRRIRDVQARAAAEAASWPVPPAEAETLWAELRQRVPSTSATDDPIGVALEARTTTVTALRRLHQLVAADPAADLTDVEVLSQLAERRYVSPIQAEIIREIISLADSAAHGPGVAADDAARLNEAAHSVARPITSSAPRVFEEDVGRILASNPSLEIEDSRSFSSPFRYSSRRSSIEGDYRVRTGAGWVLIEAKFWTQVPRDIATFLLTRAERAEAAGTQGLHLVVPNIAFDEEALDLPAFGRIFTVTRFQRMVASGELGRLGEAEAIPADGKPSRRASR